MRLMFRFLFVGRVIAAASIHTQKQGGPRAGASVAIKICAIALAGHYAWPWAIRSVRQYQLRQQQKQAAVDNDDSDNSIWSWAPSWLPIQRISDEEYKRRIREDLDREERKTTRR